jgi:hypothetical protein
MDLVRESLHPEQDTRIDISAVAARNLSESLNIAIAQSECPWVARMDDDDVSHRDRLCCQRMLTRTGLDVIGCAFEVRDRSSDKLLAIESPPTDPKRLAWEMYLKNPLAHGSVLMRRTAVLTAGGYDTTLDRAQDYDLWLRLRGRIAACPEVLYTYYVEPKSAFSSSPEQARCAAHLQMKAWGTLPVGNPDVYAPSLALTMNGAPAHECLHTVHEQLTAAGPTLCGLLALRQVQSLLTLRPAMSALAPAPAPVRVQDINLCLAPRDGTAVYLYGAGASTPVALTRLREHSITIAALVDDALAGVHRFGLDVIAPSQVPDHATVLIASHVHGATLYERSATMRARGVRVERLAA